MGYCIVNDACQHIAGKQSRFPSLTLVAQELHNHQTPLTMSTIQPTKEQTIKAQEDIAKAAESPEAIRALGEDIEKATKEGIVFAGGPG